ncbi:Lsr2 family protein [Arthrobacter sp. 2RAF6]|uniref:histone-like nucleoid-structuring protein Lsr2 n=1 Tax=Arthrobacter sp. 2RAF6 TaxID=3233002 RepID=UPI003F92A789
MTREVIPRLVDDLDGSEATQTIEFSFQGISYQFDLNDSNATYFESLLSPYIEKGAKQGGVTAGTKRTAAASTLTKARTKRLRAWALEHQIPMADRGKIAQHIVERYESATGDRA